MFKCGVYLVFILVFSQSIKADVADTVIALEQVVTKGVRFEQLSVGTKSVQVDTFQLRQYQTNSLAELLQQQSLVNITSYGPGGLSGIKIRGGSADHTTIVWNGLNIKPPMSGEMNLSSINAGLFDNIFIQPGASSTIYGTGAATGVVSLSNSLDLSKKGFAGHVGSEYGSFNTYGLNASGKYIGSKFGSRFAASYQNSENNFKFVNTDRFGSPLDTLKHAGYNTFSLVQQNLVKLAESATLETDFWYSKHQKLVPSLTSSTIPGKNEQIDEDIHFALNFAKYGNNWFIKYRGGILYYSIDYLNNEGSGGHSSLNRSWSYINELESKYSLAKSHLLFFGVNSTIDHAKVTDYSGNPWRNTLDLFGRYYSAYFNNHLKFNLEGRQSIVDGKAIPFVYSGGVEIKMLKGLAVKSAASKLYNLPDLNDLYWVNTAYASGNSLLEPEFGWNTEIGLQQKHSFTSWKLEHELTVYRNELWDAINWAEDSTGKWIPNNYKRNKTKGLEFIGSIQTSIGKSNFCLAYDYVYTHAIVLKETDTSAIEIPKVYIPNHKAGLRFTYSINGFSTAVYWQSIGERPMDNNNGILESYKLVDFYCNYQFNIKKSSLLVYLKAKNILNTSYKLVPSYAQPLRGIYAGINYKL